MSIWARFAELIASTAGAALSTVIEAVRTVFEGDPETRRRVAFSVAMIALSAKMAKADGVVTDPEVVAFNQIFEVPAQDRGNVEALFGLAKRDVAGFEAYASKIAGLCGESDTDCPALEDILDGLFHIAKSDGVVHERELGFLERVSEIFGLTPARFEAMVARHVDQGRKDPYTVLGIKRDASLAEARKAWIVLVRDHHPDKALARGMPEEFVAIANQRLAAINAAYDEIEREKRAA
jgi:DnaJ like chaperone protein